MVPLSAPTPTPPPLAFGRAPRGDGGCSLWRGSRLFSIVYLTNLTKYSVSYLSKYPVKIIRAGDGGAAVLRREVGGCEHEAAVLAAAYS